MKNRSISVIIPLKATYIIKLCSLYVLTLLMFTCKLNVGPEIIFPRESLILKNQSDVIDSLKNTSPESNISDSKDLKSIMHSFESRLSKYQYILNFTDTLLNDSVYSPILKVRSATLQFKVLNVQEADFPRMRAYIINFLKEEYIKQDIIVKSDKPDFSEIIFIGSVFYDKSKMDLHKKLQETLMLLRFKKVRYLGSENTDGVSFDIYNGLDHDYDKYNQ